MSCDGDNVYYLTYLKFPFLGKNSLNCRSVGCKPGNFERYGKSSSKYVYTVTVDSISAVVVD